METLGKRSLSKPERNLKRWNETGTGIMLFKAQADKEPIGDDLRVRNGEHEGYPVLIRCKKGQNIEEAKAKRRMD